MRLVFFWNPLLYWISMLFAKSCMVLASFGIVTLHFACFRNVSEWCPGPCIASFFLVFLFATFCIFHVLFCVRNVSEKTCILWFSL